MCTLESHRILKTNRAAYLRATVDGYWQPEVDLGLEREYRTCRCGSSISDGTTRPLRTEHVLGFPQLMRVA